MVQHLTLDDLAAVTGSDLDGDALTERITSSAGVVDALRVLQETVGWLPAEGLRLVAEALEVPLARVHGVATFYASFHLEPRGKHVLRVCQGTACHVGGADRLVDALSKHLGIGLGETTDDLVFTLESAACLGCCSLAPVVADADQTWGRLDGAGAVAVADTLARRSDR